jgi:hypothetical protein
VGPSASLLLSGPDCCPPRRRLPEAASSRYRELGRRRRGRPCQQASHGAGRRCPAGGVHPSGYWRPGIRLSSRPVSGHLGWSSSGSGDRPSAVHPSAVQPSAVHLSGVQPSGVCPVGPDASVSSHAQALALGTRSSWPGDPDHQNRWRPRWLPSRRRLDGRSRRPDAGDAAHAALVRGGRWRSRAAGVGAGRGGRACPLSDQAGQVGARSAPRGRLPGGHRSRRQRADGGIRRVAGVLGLGRDHGGWSSPSLTPGWAAPAGPGEGPAGMGVRPQRGPSRQRARPARCQQRSDLRRWVVGLPGLEPGTSSLSEMDN